MSKNVLVTGANRGIGLEFARQLNARGDRVIATCRNPAAADELVELGVPVHALDVADQDAARSLAEELGDAGLDMLVNNAGVGVNSVPLGQIDYAEMEEFYRVNCVGALRLAEALLPALRRGDGRTIVNVTSRMGSIVDNTSGGAYAYRASKAALNMVTKSLAIDLADERFTCVVVHPGWVQTSMGGSSAPVSIPDSVRGLLRVMDSLDTDDSGSFIDYTGERLRW